MRQIGFLFLAFFVLVSDQISKWFVMERILVPALGLPERTSLDFAEWYAASLERLPYTEVAVWPFFNWVMVWNRGISFGLFNAESEYMPTILIVLACVISLAFTIWLMFSKNWLQSTAIALVIGGALGNALDRVRFEAVIDFLDVHVYGFHWPAFNIGDSAIVVGVIILMLCSFTPQADTIEDSAGHNP